MAYCVQFKPEKIREVHDVCQRFVQSIKDYKPLMLQKPKFHLLLHLADNMVKFGPTSAFNTERYLFRLSDSNYTIGENLYTPIM